MTFSSPNSTKSQLSIWQNASEVFFFRRRSRNDRSCTFVRKALPQNYSCFRTRMFFRSEFILMAEIWAIIRRRTPCFHISAEDTSWKLSGSRRTMRWCWGWLVGSKPGGSGFDSCSLKWFSLNWRFGNFLESAGSIRQLVITNRA